MDSKWTYNVGLPNFWPWRAEPTQIMSTMSLPWTTEPSTNKIMKGVSLVSAKESNKKQNSSHRLRLDIYQFWFFFFKKWRIFHCKNSFSVKTLAKLPKKKFPKIKANDFLGENILWKCLFLFPKHPKHIFNKKYQLLAPAFCFWLNLTRWLKKQNSKWQIRVFFGFSNRQICTFFFLGNIARFLYWVPLACNQECEWILNFFYFHSSATITNMKKENPTEQPGFTVQNEKKRKEREKKWIVG